MTCLVVGLGQARAGDDAVGLRVLAALAGRDLPPGVRAVRAADPSALPLLLDGPDRAVLVDALLDPGPPGRVLVLAADALAGRPALGTHGLDVPAALELARALGASAAGSVQVVAVTIAAAERFTDGLSPAVEAAVGPAADAALRLAAGILLDRTAPAL